MTLNIKDIHARNPRKSVHNLLKQMDEDGNGEIEQMEMLNFFADHIRQVKGEAERGAKQRADNISIRDESRAGSYFRSSRASSLTTVTILILDPNPFRDSLRLSQH